jgi:hypothetical protein
MAISTSFASSGLTLMGFTKCSFIKSVLVRGDPSLGSSCGFARRPAPPRIVILLCPACGPRDQTNIATDRREIKRNSLRHSCNAPLLFRLHAMQPVLLILLSTSRYNPVAVEIPLPPAMTGCVPLFSMEIHSRLPRFVRIPPTDELGCHLSSSIIANSPISCYVASRVPSHQVEVISVCFTLFHELWGIHPRMLGNRNLVHACTSLSNRIIPTEP